MLGDCGNGGVDEEGSVSQHERPLDVADEKTTDRIGDVDRQMDPRRPSEARATRNMARNSTAAASQIRTRMGIVWF